MKKKSKDKNLLKSFIYITTIVVTVGAFIYAGFKLSSQSPQDNTTSNASNTSTLSNNNSNKESTKENQPSKNNGETETKTDYSQKITQEITDTKEIEATSLLVNRVLIQLGEIQSFQTQLGIKTNTDIGLSSSQEDDSTRYSDLLSKIDEDKGVYYTLKLKKDFTGSEEAFDEFLASLQLDIDIALYLNDKKEYDKIKGEKLSGATDQPLTVRDIENKSLENLQKLNDSNKFSSPDDINPNTNMGIPPNPNENINNQIEVPGVKDPRPVDPAEQIRNNIIDIS